LSSAASLIEPMAVTVTGDEPGIAANNRQAKEDGGDGHAAGEPGSEGTGGAHG